MLKDTQRHTPANLHSSEHPLKKTHTSTHIHTYTYKTGPQKACRHLMKAVTAISQATRVIMDPTQIFASAVDNHDYLPMCVCACVY